MFEVFQLPFVQRGVLVIAALAVLAGVLGTWIVLRDLAFFAHAAGTATFPGLVLADGLGIAAVAGALGAAAAVAVAVALLSARRPHAADALTALVLVAALAVGVLLASDVFASQARIEQYLFGSLLTVDGGDAALAAALSALALAATVVLGPRWLAVGFDPASAGAVRTFDALLLALVALAVVVSVTAVGALLVGALLIVPAATARLVAGRVWSMQVLTVFLVFVEGTGGLWIAVETDTPPGAMIAVIAGGTFAAVALCGALVRGRRAVAAATALAAAIATGGCGAGAGTDGRPVVMASTPVVADLVRNVVGTAVDVRQVLPANADPHSYEPRPSDLRAAVRARLVFASGLGLDAFAGDVAAAGDAPLIALGDRVPGAVRAGDGERDPHWWHDPRNAVAAVATIAAEVGKAIPAARGAIDARARGYARRIKVLDRRIAACLEAVAAQQRKLVTDHDAFGHLAARYDIEIVGAVIPSSTTAAEPSAGDLAALAATIRRERVRAVFPASSADSRLARALVRETGARADLVLYADTLGPRGSDGDTYLGALAHNARALVEGFSGGRQRCRVRP